MALRERNVCTDEGLVPSALAIHSSLLSSSTQRRMSSMNFLSETLCFIPTRPTARYFWLRTRGRHAVGPRLAHASRAQQQLDAARYIPPPGIACTISGDGSKDTNRFQALYRLEHAAPNQGLRRGSGQLSALIHRSAWNGRSRRFTEPRSNVANLVTKC